MTLVSVCLEIYVQSDLSLMLSSSLAQA